MRSFEVIVTATDSQLEAFVALVMKAAPAGTATPEWTHISAEDLNRRKINFSIKKPTNIADKHVLKWLTEADIHGRREVNYTF